MKKLFVTLTLMFAIIFSVLFVDTVTANAEEANVISYTVMDGDTLWDIAEEIFGNGAEFDRIFDANSSVIVDPSKIYPGQILTIVIDDVKEEPAVEEEKPVEEEENKQVENTENTVDNTETNFEVAENNTNIDNNGIVDNTPAVEEDNSTNNTTDIIEEDGIIFEKNNSNIEEEPKSGANVKNNTVSGGELTYIGDGEEENNTGRNKTLNIAQCIIVAAVATVIFLIIVLIIQIISTFIPINFFRRKKNRK